MDELQPGRELDAMIAERVMGWPHIGETDAFRLFTSYGGVIFDGVPEKFTIGSIPHRWEPSTDIAAAWDAVERVQSELREVGSRGGICDVRLTVHRYGPEGDYRVAFSKHPMRRLYAAAWSKSLPHAICLAALKAVGEGVE